LPEDIKATLWKSADKLRAQMDAAEYKHIVLGLIFLKYISDTFVKQQEKVKSMVSGPSSDYFISEDPAEYAEELEERDYYTQDNVFWVPQEARWETLRSKAKQPDIGSLVDDAMTKIENKNNSLRGKLDKRFGRTQLGQGVLGELIDLISTIGFADKYGSSDLLGEVYEYFLGQFASAEGKKGGQFYTPSHVVKTLVAVLSPDSGRVYDPCCGSGGMFVQSEEFVKAHGGRVDDISIYGQESNPTTWRLAAMNLAIRGFAADLGKENGDTFANDQFPDKKFDFILSNPPFNDSEWGGEKYDNDKRWTFGVPPTSNANYAWLQHILWKLKPEGKAGVVLGSSSVSARGVEGEIRAKLVDAGHVAAIISLPAKIFVNTLSTSTCIWLLSKKSIKHRKILLIDATTLSTPVSDILSEMDSYAIKRIRDTVRSWESNSSYEDSIAYCKEVDIEEIKEKNYSLNPTRYVGFSTEYKQPTSAEELSDLVEQYRLLRSHSELLEKRMKSSLQGGL